MASNTMRSIVDVWMDILNSWMALNVRRHASFTSSNCVVVPSFSSVVGGRGSSDLREVWRKGRNETRDNTR